MEDFVSEVCQKASGERTHDETANCEESCDGGEGDWL